MRLFVSISLTPEMKKYIRTHMAALKQVAYHGRYPNEENFHITLAFIGEYNDIPKVKAALETVIFSTFEITVGGFGNFGSTHFVRVNSKCHLLDDLAEKVKNALDAAGVPFDRKKFISHITIGRDVDTKYENIPRIDTSSVMQVAKFSLMRSDLIGGKRIYKEIFSIDSTKS